MNNPSDEQRLHYLLPGQSIPAEVVQQIDTFNKKYNREKHFNFSQYQDALHKLFNIPRFKLTTEHNIYLGGFVEGEGSINVSAKKQSNCRFGIEIDPEFSITQHVNGVEQLLYALEYFKTGTIFVKPDSGYVLTFRISNTQSIREKVLPFYQNYIIPYAAYHRRVRFAQFKKLIDALEQKKHLNLDTLVYEVAPLWKQMQMQVDTPRRSFNTLEELQEYMLSVARAKGHI
jgi:hypothetical protein